jgi:amino acid adenylation domain-containing protein
VKTSDSSGIAIIGMSGRFPGAADVDTFWRNLCEGVESISRFDVARLEDAFEPAERLRPDFVAARSVLPDPGMFDAGFFGMHAREAELVDPQHRVVLECSWEALEDAGYDPARYSGAIGVIAGCSIGSYFLRHVLRDRAAVERFTSDYQVGSYPELLGSGHDFLATRVAYKLNLRGPAMTVQSACSTSLLGVVQACQALLLQQADMMIAAAASITFPQERGSFYQEGGMIASDGHCRTFDARATGTVFGSGAGAVLLKRVEDALADGDSIYAVIRGFGINNDGSAKIGYTAPSVEGQAAAVEAAHRMAGFDAASIGYVECHGTATPLGDPIEIAALKRAFRATDAPASCALGSVKTNIGHLDVAAGMSGLIKTALAVRHAKIPPTLHYTSPNPHIDFSGSPFFVNAALSEWPDERRRAGVSAFGLGGTNVHVVLESAPARPATVASGLPQLLVVSARSEDALDAACRQLASDLRDDTGRALDDVAYTLQTGRRDFAYRAAFAAATTADAVRKLSAPARAELISGRAAKSERSVAFMFPGQGAQYAGMGRDLYVRSRVFRDAFDSCVSLVPADLGRDLRALLRLDKAVADAGELTATALAQPAIFAIEYALAHVWMDWGIEPAAMIGHSVGEFVAACLAGVFTLEDALGIVAERGRLMQALPPGAMLAVRLPESELAGLLDASLSLAAVNGSALCVAAGPLESIALLEQRLTERDVPCRKLETSHAFHSPMMDPVLEPLAARIATVPLQEPALPYVSGVTGSWITAGEATSPRYWARHCREKVRFADGLATLVEGGSTLLLEVGPGSALATFARSGAAKGSDVVAVSSLPSGSRIASEFSCLLEALGRVWVAGAGPDWNRLHDGAVRRRVSLPAYPFERTLHWIEAPAAERTANVALPPITTVLTEMEPVLMTETATLRQSASAKNPEERRVNLQRDLGAMLEELSGETISDEDSNTGFLELGFDSLFLGRFAQQLQNRFSVAITFRQLLGDLSTIRALADFILPQLPAEAAETPAAELAPLPAPVATNGVVHAPGASSAVEALMREQLQTLQQLMRDQLSVLQGLPQSMPAPSTAPTVAAQPAPQPAKSAKPDETPSRFDAYKIVGASRAETTPAQAAHIESLIRRTVERTPRSKELTQKYRSVLADPRVAAGFRAEWKEMVYPLTVTRAQGAHLWDIDGNEYIDVLNGFGQTAFGHAPGFVVDAVHDQLDRGFAIGPQTELAGQVAELFCKITGNERVTFCNTGSEAVMAALRVARTVTGRNRVVVFNGAYHGQFDEVLVKGARTSTRSLPVAPGIPPESVSNMTVLTYGAPESVDWVREHAHELAAVVVEPVQSRHPGLQPAAFLKELRAITEASGTALVFDEVVTGFRMHVAGMQHVFGIRADLATYGKVVGGGMPIGILAGTPRFMDALDGGMWAYGDDSYPEVAPTFFAGTFVRHPLVMAATLAVLRHLEAEGPKLQDGLTARTARLVDRLNAELARREIESRIETCGSLFYFSLAAEDRLASLLYYHLRLRGIYIQEGFPCFLTTQHTDEHVEQIVTAFVESLDELAAVGILVRGSGALAAGAAESPVDVPLTEEQTEIWLAAQLGDDASCAFNESVTLRLSGRLDEAAFADAWNRLIARHDALRASFAPTGESMHIGAPFPLAYADTDLSQRGEAAAEQALSEIVALDARAPFDLVAGPLVRGHLVRLGDHKQAFILTAHHIICDGWSMNVLLDEFAAIYGGLARGETLNLPPALSFAEYARRQHARDAGELKAVERFWLAEFAEPVSPLELPTDRPRVSPRSFAGGTRNIKIDAERYRAIKKAGARQGCTLFTTLLAGFATLVGRLADSEDVVVGIPAAGQSLLKDEILVGHCVDFLPIRNRWNGGDALADLLSATKQKVIDAYEHQTYTLGTIVRQLNLPRESARVPLTEVQFNLERLAEDFALPGVAVAVEPNGKAFVNFDLFFNVIESREGLRLDCDYNASLFDPSTIDRFLQYYVAILDAIASDASQPIRAVSYLSGDERALALSSAFDTLHAVPNASSVHGLFEARAAAQPAAVAATCAGEAVTYEDLNRRADRLARRVVESVKAPGALVGVSVERSVDMLVSLLAVLKAGCAYVPLDRIHPSARLRQMVDAAGVAAVISDDAGQCDFVSEHTRLIDLRREAQAPATAAGSLSVAVAPDALAYVIFTSGSTGTPKGVEITHRSVVNFLSAMARKPGLSAKDVLLAVTTISFDIAALELFLPLTVGATVAIATKDDVGDGFRLLDRITSAGVSAMQATPATWRLLLEAGFRAPYGFKMLCGGEALPRDLANRLLEGDGELWNMYGPTETTIWSSCVAVHSGDEPITIGRPIDNTQFYVLDSYDQPLPVGRPGQLHIGGDGVARGYVGQPELTAEKFVPNPFHGGRMYRTGDLARLLPSGEVVVTGRMDNQVKLRGFRIELGEIESVLAQHAGLSASAVTLREDPSGARLVGYFVEQADSPRSPADLSGVLAQHLPEYMIPTAWVRLERLPLSANGKLDRAALPAPGEPDAAEEFLAPQTPVELALAAIWRDVLQLERVGLSDDLFALGADSIHLFKITARANRQGIPILAKQLMKQRTIAALARGIDDAAVMQNSA